MRRFWNYTVTKFKLFEKEEGTLTETLLDHVYFGIIQREKALNRELHKMYDDSEKKL